MAVDPFETPETVKNPSADSDNEITVPVGGDHAGIGKRLSLQAGSSDHRVGLRR